MVSQSNYEQAQHCRRGVEWVELSSHLLLFRRLWIKMFFALMPYSLKLFFIGLVTLPSGLLILLLAPFDRTGKLVDRISRWWSWAILRIGGVRLKVEGLDRLDPSRQYIFMANHRSNIDIPVLVQSLAEFQLRWLAKKELLFVPFFGWAVLASRQIIVDRSNRSRAIAILRRAREKIAGGISVVIFPEGTRSISGQLLPFKKGGFVLALRTRTPIVPVVINGSGTILPRRDWRIRPGEIEVIIGEPLPVEQYHPANIPSLVGHVRKVIESHSLQHVGSVTGNYQDARVVVEKAALARG